VDATGDLAGLTVELGRAVGMNEERLQELRAAAEKGRSPDESGAPRESY
jgi:hypothetical protein